MVIGLDELNTRSMPYEKFFGEMELTEVQIKERIALAKEFEEEFLFLLIWMSDLISKETINYKPVKTRIASEWGRIAGKQLYDEDFVKKYAEDFAENAVESTLRHVGDDWYFSEDRAVFNAENEALTIFNRADFLDAVENGKTSKTWNCLLDGRERDSHKFADGQTVGIFEVFHVGAATLFHPRDVSELGDGAMHPREIINCRCYCSYGNEKVHASPNNKANENSNFGLNNSGRSDNITLEMRSKRNRDRSDEKYTFISDKRFNDIVIPAVKRGAIIMRGGEEVEKHLDSVGANASCIGNVMLFRENVTASEAVEETRHFLQNYDGLNGDKPIGLRMVLNEIDAKQFIIENAAKYQIPRIEVDETIKELERYKKLLEGFEE